MIYTDSFKAKIVQRLSAPNAISAISLSKEVGVSQSQLSRWLQRARTVVPTTKERPSYRAVQPGTSTRSVEEKLRIVMAAAALGPDELGAFLRRKGCTQGPRSRGDRGAAGAPRKVHEIWGDGDDGTGEGNAK